MQAVGVTEIGGSAEEGLQAALRTGDDCGVVTEEEPSDNRHQHYAGKVGPAARLSVSSHLYIL